MSRATKSDRQAPRRGGSRAAASRSGARLLEGDCLEVLGKLEPESVDAIVTDPPYGIGFQNARWDSSAIREAAARAGHERLSPNEAFEAWCRIWATECRRVMKPERTTRKAPASGQRKSIAQADSDRWCSGSFGLLRADQLPVI